MMEEYNSNSAYLKAFPPRLEDAGLEDTVLSAEGIQVGSSTGLTTKHQLVCPRVFPSVGLKPGLQEAFHRAAEMVRSAASSIVGGEHKDAGCVGNLGPSNGSWTDVVDSPGLDWERRPKSCVDTNTGGLIEEGHDLVVQGGGATKEDKLVQGDVPGAHLGEGTCVEGERDVGDFPGTGGIASDGDRKDGDGPILTGAFL